MDYKEGKRILKKDANSLSFIKKNLREEIEKDIEECLEKQQSEIDSIFYELQMLAKQRFKSISELKMFIVNNVPLPVSNQQL